MTNTRFLTEWFRCLRSKHTTIGGVPLTFARGAAVTAVHWTNAAPGRTVVPTVALENTTATLDRSYGVTPGATQTDNTRVRSTGPNVASMRTAKTNLGSPCITGVMVHVFGTCLWCTPEFMFFTTLQDATLYLSVLSSQVSLSQYRSSNMFRSTREKRIGKSVHKGHRSPHQLNLSLPPAPPTK